MTGGFSVLSDGDPKHAILPAMWVGVAVVAANSIIYSFNKSPLI